MDTNSPTPRVTITVKNVKVRWESHVCNPIGSSHSTELDIDKCKKRRFCLIVFVSVVMDSIGLRYVLCISDLYP